MQFVPDRDPFRNCLTCSRLGHLDYAADVAVCRHKGETAVHQGWRDGCSFWEREVGTTDEIFPVVVDEKAFQEAVRYYKIARR
jgi:hypothetical protein